MSFKKGSDYDIHDLRTLGHTKESRKLMSEKLLKVWQDPEYRENQSKAHMGNEVTQETREKISTTMTGYIKSEEHRKNLSDSLAKRSLMNDEQREHLRQVNLGKKQSADTLAKRSESLKGKTGKRYVYKTPMGDFTSLSKGAKANNMSDDQLRRRCLDEWDGFSRIKLPKKT